MTTAPTPSEKVQRLAITLEIVCAVPDMNYVTVPRHVARDASVELRRLQGDNERMRSAERTLHRLGYQDRGGQEWAPPIGKAPDFDLIDSLRSRIAGLEARKPLPPDALADKCEAWLQAGGASNIVDAFEAGYRAAEET